MLVVDVHVFALVRGAGPHRKLLRRLCFVSQGQEPVSVIDEVLIDYMDDFRYLVDADPNTRAVVIIGMDVTGVVWKYEVLA